MNSLIELTRYEEAEAQIKNEIKKQRTPNPGFLINWGYLLKAQNRNEEAESKYSEALNIIPASKGNYLIAANNFLQWAEYEWAEKVYLRGRQVLPQEQFSYELARVYMYLRSYEKMMEEYLDLIRSDEKQLRRIESSLASALRIDVNDDFRDGFRQQVLKRIQAEPDVTGYNRLLIWFLLQDKQFAGALRQSIALDRRTGGEDAQIFQLGNLAMNNQMYGEAKKAYDYLILKDKESPFYQQAFLQNIHASYLQYINENSDNKEDGRVIAGQFEKGLELLAYSASTLNMIREYSHLLAFYLGETDNAISILEKGLKIPGLKPEESGIIKTEMADIYVYIDDQWEAVLLYSQVIDENKNNELADEVKLKKATLGYYMGNFSWAKAQLDVLKGSTSRFTANDAMELSMLIGNNLNLDTTAVPLQMFARADLLFFRNRDSLALATLDSLADLFPYHVLVDDILFRKSKIEIDRNNYLKAAEYLEQIRAEFSYELLADDALYMLAELYNYKLGQKEEAKELYREMLTMHPGSVFIEESREKFRELREQYPDETGHPAEEEFIEESVPDEIN
ncbi:MAG: tetratricopeptide repeat protein [Prolixibacteraceae bacterium]|nr:tetratricopeptide repeat protein [Prolixibacteraceae bacterium]